MIELNNKHIVLVFIIIIVVVFIYNFDVYVISKDEPLCKPIYITKREITPEIRAELNKTESGVLKEAFGNLSKSGYIESFGNIMNETQSSNPSIYDVPPKSFSSFTIPSITNKSKLRVMDSVIKILSYIPTNYCESQIKQLVEYFAIIYETSPDLETFYKNVASSTKIKDPPYNSKYAHLILFLIGKFDNDYSKLSGSTGQNEKCAMNELISQIMKSNPSLSDDLEQNVQSSSQSIQPIQPIQPIQSVQQANTTNSENTSQSVQQSVQQSNPTQPDYLSEQISNLIDSNNLDPSNIMNIIKKTKNENKSKPKLKSKSNPNVILPSENVSINTTYPESEGYLQGQYLQEQHSGMSYVPNYYPSESSRSNNSSNPNVYGISDKPTIGKSILKKYKSPQDKNCNGAKCSYKCDSSYMNAISYLDSELKPLEGFGSIDNNYATF